MQPPPAEPGMREDEVDTPALLVDLDAMEDNFDRMAAFCAAAGVKLRAHAKTHKSPVVAHWQAARGAVGQCVQKVSEAEVLAWGGVRDILVSNEVVSPRKLARLAALAPCAEIALCADDIGAVAHIEAAACRLRVLVEIDVGAGRCGVALGPDAVALARRIAASPHLAFAGLQAYHGGAQHLRSLEERRAAIDAAAETTRRTVEALAAVGLACPIVGGAGTFALEAASGVFTELQAGSYVFMDADYGRNDPAPDFRQSLFVLTTVMSAARDGVAVVDCGHKGIGGRQRPASRPRLCGYRLYRRLRRALPARARRRWRQAAHRRAAAPRARSLRPDGRPLRLVCRPARRTRRAGLAGGRARHDGMTA